MAYAKDEDQQRGGKTMRQDPVRVSLCGGDKCCPEVAIDVTRNQVQIGEEGNLVTLDRRAWNALIEKIQSGELKQL